MPLPSGAEEIDPQAETERITGIRVFPDPASFTFIQFITAWNQACLEAWEDGRREMAAVTLPEGVLPGLEEVANPVTRSEVKITRVPMFTPGTSLRERAGA